MPLNSSIFVNGLATALNSIRNCIPAPCSGASRSMGNVRKVPHKLHWSCREGIIFFPENKCLAAIFGCKQDLSNSVIIQEANLSSSLIAVGIWDGYNHPSNYYSSSSSLQGIGFFCFSLGIVSCTLLLHGRSADINKPSKTSLNSLVATEGGRGRDEVLLNVVVKNSWLWLIWPVLSTEVLWRPLCLWANHPHPGVQVVIPASWHTHLYSTKSIYLQWMCLMYIMYLQH